MKLILAGGGDPEQSLEVDTFFYNLLRKKKVLFLPDAVSPEIWSIEESLNWLNSQPLFKRCQIDVWENLNDVNLNKVLSYEAIYIMGGNTYKLLNVIRKNKLEIVFEEFLNHDKIIYGLSAGAIVFGNSIHTADTGPEKDENYLGLRNFSGLNFLGSNYLVATHYINESDTELKKMSEKLQKKIIGIPETSGVFVNNDNCKVIGRDSIFIFNDKLKTEIKIDESFKL